MSLMNRLKCIVKGHNIIVDYPWHEYWYKNGIHYHTWTQLRYCNRCKRAFK